MYTRSVSFLGVIPNLPWIPRSSRGMTNSRRSVTPRLKRVQLKPKIQTRLVYGRFIFFFLSLGYVTTTFSQGMSCADLVRIQNPWIREPIESSQTTAAYLTFNNPTNTLCVLSSARANTAARVELHEHVNQNGMMKMRQVSGIVLPKQAQTELKPGGLHLMLFDLTSKLRVGDSIDMVLEYDDQSQKTVTFPVLTSAKLSTLESSLGQ